MAFAERLRSWLDQIVCGLKKRWWWPFLGVPCEFIWELVKHRVLGATNNFIDSHASFEWLRPVVLFFQNRLLSGLVIVATFAVLVVLVLVVHAYFESRSKTQSGPKLFLEYHSVPAQYILEFSGLTLKNIGTPAFNIEFEPDVRSGLTLLMDNPTGSVSSANSYPIRLQYCTVNDKNAKNPMGGVPASRIEHFFNDLLHKGEESLTITIKCRDFDGHKFAFKSILRFDRWKNEITSEIV